MSVLTTNYKGTKIKCLDMPHTNNTMIVAPINGQTFSYLIIGKQVSKQIIESESNTKRVYQKLKAKHNLYRSLLGA